MMINRVAAALTVAQWGYECVPSRQTLAMAKAAIEAMREPTDAMKQVTDDYGEFVDVTNFENYWFDRIDAALG